MGNRAYVGKEVLEDSELVKGTQDFVFTMRNSPEYRYDGEAGIV